MWVWLFSCWENQRISTAYNQIYSKKICAENFIQILSHYTSIGHRKRARNKAPTRQESPLLSTSLLWFCCVLSTFKALWSRNLGFVLLKKRNVRVAIPNTIHCICTRSVVEGETKNGRITILSKSHPTWSFLLRPVWSLPATSPISS